MHEITLAAAPGEASPGLRVATFRSSDYHALPAESRPLRMSKTYFLIALWFCAGIAFAQQPPTLADPGQKTLRLVRTGTPPTIDGVLDDAVWANAAVINDLHQVNPVEYAEPFERTEIYVLFDDESLYVGARLYDADPDLITAQNLRQNDSIGSDDRFYITLDPFNSQRSGYYFGVNPNGVRHDGLYQNVSESYDAWDGIFRAEAGRFDEGWVAEIEIPFKTISFNPNTDTWGVNFQRGVPRKNEVSAWVSRNRAFDPSSSGLAVGFEGLEQGIGLEIAPAVSVTNSRNLDTGISNSDFEPSLDLAYRLTPSLNASVTINTDFSATEVDDRQVNLTRFGLFFPEKRDFFLREADIFEFGRIGAPVDAVYRFAGGAANSQNGRPFFSRSIGLSNTGQPVDLNYGGKLSGRVGRWELGALSIRQDEFPGVPADTLSVVRAKLGVLSESSVGVIATNGSPRAATDNSVTGVDFLYRNTRLPGGRTLEAEAWFQQSDTRNLIGNDGARGFGIRLPSSTGIRVGAGIKEFEANFNPALGFISRPGVTDTTFDLSYTRRPRSGPIQSFKTSVDAQRFDIISGSLQSQSLNIRPFNLSNRTGDNVDMIHRRYTEVLFADFNISGNVTIPSGRYEFHDTGGQVRLSSHRRFAGMFRFVDGTFYSGTRRDMLGELTWRPSSKLRSNISYNFSEIELPQGNFETRLVRVGVDYVFSSTMSWVNLIQYDNISETIGLNMRWHWIPEAGRELFFVINHNVSDPDRDNRFKSISSDVTVKLGYTFRL
jgi:hypothetical protein